MTDHSEAIKAAIRREQLRCQALADDNFEQLAELLSKDLLHVHTRGNADNYESYLSYVRNTLKLLNVERGDLRLRCYGESIAMSGKQVNTAYLRDGDGTVLQIESQVSQVWAKEADGQWRLASLQATALGAPKTLRGPER